MNQSARDVSESKQLVGDGDIALGCVVAPELLRAFESGDVLPGILAHLTTSLRDQYGNPMDSSELKGKLVGLYFSAGWCGPCRQFSPVLSKFHEEKQDDFRVVLVSMDKSEPEMIEYIKGKGFLWVDFRSQSRKDLIQKLNISSLPTLVIVSPEGEVITDFGRLAVTSNPDTCVADW
eukprot:CAMPEP_0114514240 /NCGR_PEP_ID=MMETSP0109-20121206/16039_1 /TAXON_ID=29199 /ORGANISM="Chlorarachnion reptans, Strain CCCM449" /LENGTH=176 /DNA_ID=CAMNT_0001694249 /DNA_START=135 /DNA_END=662 /DNA_ORIENTATION=-